MRHAYDACAAWYDQRPATITLALSAVFLFAVWGSLFLGLQVAPYDYQTSNYPDYIDALRAAKFSVFCIYNPFNDGGTLTANLVAHFDPLEWLPMLSRSLPGYAGLQSLYLAQLFVIPIGLLLVAKANDVPPRRWILIAGIALIGYAVGPTLKYFQQLNSLTAVSFVVLAFGALEALRRFGGLGYAIVAGLSLAYVNQHWVYATVFLPVALVAYAVGNARVLLAHPRRVLELAVGAAVGLIVAAPALLLYVKYDHLIEISRQFEQLSELGFTRETFAMLGAPVAPLTLVVLPAGLIALAVAGLGSASRAQRWAFAVAIGLLVVYGFGDLTPFGPLFRKVYPLAGVIRRPYTVWYIVAPLLLVFAVRGLRVRQATVVRVVVACCGAATLAALPAGGSAAAFAVVILALAVMAVVPRPSVVVLAAVVQWAAVDVVPFWHSQWVPVPIPVAARYLAPYESVRNYLPFETQDSLQAYRIANIGLPAEFGPSAGEWRIYDTAAGYNTSFPRNLAKLLAPAPLHAATLPTFIAQHPEQFAGPNWERLGVRYYLLGPPVASALPRDVLTRPNLRLLQVPGYWRVVEDRAAAPFVGAVVGRSLVPVAAKMTRESFRLQVPARAERIRFASLYDSWWQATDDTNRDISSRVTDDGGQLTLDTRGLDGRTVTLKFTNAPVVASIALSLALQMLLIVAGLGAVVRAIAHRRRARQSAPTAPLLS